MATKDQLYQIIAAYGLGKTLPSGSTRAAARLAVNTIVGAGRIAVPTARAAAPVLARTAAANPAAAGIGGLLLAQQLGLLEPITDPIGDFVEEEVVIPIKKDVKRRKTNFNKAVSKGMKAVKDSVHYGKRGTINNAKKAFGKVTKTVSRVNKGAKVSAKGVTGTIKRAIKGIL